MKRPTIKTLALMIVLIGIVAVPDVMLDLKAKLLHVLAVALHTVYETESFLLEEWLMHSFGVDKFMAQMLVFYFNGLIGAGIVYRVWRRLPRITRRVCRRLQQWFVDAQIDASVAWQTMTHRQKARIVAVQLVGVASGFLWLMA